MTKKLLLLMMLLVLPGALALGNPNNKTLAEFQNLTRSDNILEVATEINIWLGGILGIMIWLATILVPFMMGLYSTNDPKSSLLVAFFIGSISSILLMVMGMASSFIVYMSVVGLLAMMGITKASQ